MRRFFKLIGSIILVIFVCMVSIILMLVSTESEIDRIVLSIFVVPICLTLTNKVIDSAFKEFDLTYLLEDNEIMYKYKVITEESYHKRKNELIHKINRTYPYKKLNIENSYEELKKNK